MDKKANQEADKLSKEVAEKVLKEKKLNPKAKEFKPSNIIFLK